MHSKFRSPAPDYGLSMLPVLVTLGSFLVFSDCPFLLSFLVLKFSISFRHHIIFASKKNFLRGYLTDTIEQLAVGAHKCKYFSTL